MTYIVRSRVGTNVVGFEEEGRNVRESSSGDARRVGRSDLGQQHDEASIGRYVDRQLFGVAIQHDDIVLACTTGHDLLELDAEFYSDHHHHPNEHSSCVRDCTTVSMHDEIPLTLKVF